MQILEDHNRQLEAQLQRLRQLLEEPSNNGQTATLQTRSVTASQLATDTPGKVHHTSYPDGNVTNADRISSHGVS